MNKVENAVIMAAGTSSRFAPLSFEKPKALVEVMGEVLIERQIGQLLDAGIGDIYVVTGYLAEQLAYLRQKFGVRLIHNPTYLHRNNNASIWAAREVIGNSYICSADNYFRTNPFEPEVDSAYYAAVYASGRTAEWCMQEDADGSISAVTVGGENAWYMLGHTFWSRTFARKFLRILEAEYDRPETAGKLWEAIFMEHLDELKMKIRKYPPDVIFEFDTLDELRAFDKSYQGDSRSPILKAVAAALGAEEGAIVNVTAFREEDAASAGFGFSCRGRSYRYRYATGGLEEVSG